MTELLKKGVRFNWDDKCEQAFQTLRKLLTSAPILAQPDITRPFDVYYDASGTGHGYILIPVYRRILFCPLILLSYIRYGSRLCPHARPAGDCLCLQSAQTA